MKNKKVCLNKPCTKNNLCDSCDKKENIKIVKIVSLSILGLFLLITSFIEYQESYAWFFSTIGDIFVSLYNLLPSFFQTFLQVLTFGVPILLFLGIIGVVVYVAIEEGPHY